MNAFGKRNGGGRRSAARTVAPLVALVTTVARSHSAVLVDLSRTGARIRGDDLPATGEDLMFVVEKVRAFAKVAWSREGECGIEFDGPLPPGDVQALRQAAARSAGIRPEVKAAMEDWMLGMAR